MLKRILSLGSSYNFIGVYDNTLPRYKCKICIDYFESRKQKPGAIGRGKGPVFDASIKKCTELDEDILITDRTILGEIIRSSLYPSLDKYKEKYLALGDCSPWTVDDRYNFQKYDGPDDGFKAWHQEHGLGLVMGNRMRAWMIYLNDAQSGTQFRYYPDIRAKMGRCVIWPAGWTHSHRGAPNIGLKYIATGWCSWNKGVGTNT